ncbi:hypothetical protein F4781DRAFT_421917 [Annulohypoxylon bovei var. microspora]|nr:hypothetical protein F4781DRAFT_421917 [Annulohypoxylon bovei var. microspora]
MSSFSGKQIFNHARSKLKKSKGLRGIIKKLSIRRITNQPGDAGDPNSLIDNDDQSSIGNPASPIDLGITLTNNSSDTNAQNVKPKNAIIQTEQKVSGLLLLPQELFDHITSYLGHAHIVLLALINKELMYRFMTSCIRLGIVEPYEPVSYRVLNKFIQKADSSKTKIRGTLLSLIDYDMEDVVYCYKCRRLHDPFLTFKDRAYAPWKAARCADWSMDHHMPPRATRKLLRTITKRRLHGAEYRHLLQQVNNTQTTYHKGILAQVSLRARYRNGDLLLKRQQVISPIDKSALSLWLFGQMLKDPPSISTSFLSLPKIYLMCNHQNWASVFAPLIQHLIEPLCEGDHSGQSEPKHTPACFSSEPLDVSKHEGHMIYERLKRVTSSAKHNPMDVPTLLGDVLGCTKCTTDFSIDVVPLPGPFGWGFVLSTWLDLGRLDFCSKWDSHREARPCREIKRQLPHGDICEMFEDLSSRLDYRPQISEANLFRMHNYMWSARARVGKDRYMNWSSGHTCDPATGWIDDPDPLEEADR